MVSVAYFVLTVVVIAKFGDAQNLKKGDTCILEKSGDSGVCVPLKDCKSAKMELRFGKRPQVCLRKGSVSIVCCDTAQGGFNSLASSGAIPSLFLRRISRAADLSYLICPVMPPDAVKVQKTGQKAWDSYGDPKLPADISWNCGGSLISELWVLTAAHCLNAGVGRSASLVRLGGGNLKVPPTEENLYTINLLLKHPKYRRISKYNDIGLIQLNREVEFSKDVRPICLHTGEPVDDERALVSGWGANETRGDMTENLLKATVQKFTFEECAETYEAESPKFTQGVLNTTQTCYGHRNESHDTCQGDSGGPLQIYNNKRVDCTYLLIGITSFGKVCGEVNIPAIYTRVSGFIPWIEETVWPDN